jgi:hypothetical protein
MLHSLAHRGFIQTAYILEDLECPTHIRSPLEWQTCTDHHLLACDFHALPLAVCVSSDVSAARSLRSRGRSGVDWRTSGGRAGADRGRQEVPKGTREKARPARLAGGRLLASRDKGVLSRISGEGLLEA